MTEEQGTCMAEAQKGSRRSLQYLVSCGHCKNFNSILNENRDQLQNFEKGNECHIMFLKALVAVVFLIRDKVGQLSEGYGSNLR